MTSGNGRLPVSATGQTPRAERRLLLVTYHFPPDPAVGALRPAKTVKYLGELGWRPYVLTVNERYLGGRDESRLADVEGIPVVRTAVWPTLSRLLLGARNRLRQRWDRRRSLAPGGAGLPGDAGRRAERAVVRDTVRRYLDSIFELPDEHAGWFVPAVWAGYRLIRREGISLVVTSSPPSTTGLVGLALSRLTGATLVTELRDPWFSPQGRPADSSSALGNLIQRSLEGRLLRRSSRIVTTTDHYRQFLATAYADIPAERFCTVWNGFDSEDFAHAENQVQKREASSPLTIAYLGTFYLGRTPREFLQAVAELVREGAIAESELRIRFIGAVRRAEGQSVDQLVGSYGLAGCVTIEDPVGHRQALAIMKAADVLLLLAPDQYYCIPAKAYEYMGAGRRILCLAREGATAALIRHTGAGVVVAPDDVEGIKRAVQALARESRPGCSAATPSTARYERRVLAEEFSRVLESCDGVRRLRARLPGLRGFRKAPRRMWGRVLRTVERRRAMGVRAHPQAVRDRIREARTVLFVCHANAIRSVLAARWLVHVLGDRATVAVRSAGLGAVSGWRAHRHAAAAAVKRSLDLHDHRSVRLTADVVEAADVVFVMELSHLVEMRQRFPRAWRKTFLLTCLAPEAPLEIADPWDQPEAAVEACFDQIVAALEPIARALTGGHAARSIGDDAAADAPAVPARRGRVS